MRPDDFDNWSVGARFYPLLYILTRVNASRDIANGMRLSHALLGKQSELQVRQIVPKKRLYDAGYGRPEVNALANFCFLTAHGNQSISASDPAVYLAQAEERNPGVLASQWIPQDETLWHIDRYRAFLAAPESTAHYGCQHITRLDTVIVGRTQIPSLPADHGRV